MRVCGMNGGNDMAIDKGRSLPEYEMVVTASTQQDMTHPSKSQSSGLFAKT
jgi:hypothetical protein